MFSISKDSWGFLDRREFINTILISGLYQNLLFYTSLWKRWRYESWLPTQQQFLKSKTRKERIRKSSCGLIGWTSQSWEKGGYSKEIPLGTDVEKRLGKRKAVWTSWITLYWTFENLSSQRELFFLFGIAGFESPINSIHVFLMGHTMDDHKVWACWEASHVTLWKQFEFYFVRGDSRLFSYRYHIEMPGTLWAGEQCCCYNATLTVNTNVCTIKHRTHKYGRENFSVTIGYISCGIHISKYIRIKNHEWIHMRQNWSFIKMVTHDVLV